MVLQPTEPILQPLRKKCKAALKIVHKCFSSQVGVLQQQEQDPTNLYIANLPHYMTENDLEQMFTRFGQVISTRILRDNNGISRGVGFCRMDSKDKCDQIIKAFNGTCLPGELGGETICVCVRSYFRCSV